MMLYKFILLMTTLVRGKRKFRAFDPRKDAYAIGRIKIRLLNQFEKTHDSKVEQTIMRRWARVNQWIRNHADLSDFYLAGEQSNFDLLLDVHCEGKGIRHPAPQDKSLGSWWKDRRIQAE